MVVVEIEQCDSAAIAKAASALAVAVAVAGSKHTWVH